MRFCPRFLLMLPLLLWETAWAANCASSSYTVNSQDELDALEATGCDTILGNLTIADGFFPELVGLANLTSVGGDLRIYNNTFLLNLDGLANLVSVGGDLRIYRHNSLQNVDGLANLSSIGGELRIEDNTALTNIDGLANLTSVLSDLYIQDNTVLTSIDGLASLSSVAGGLSIRYNPPLKNLGGLANLTSVGGYLQINDNYFLENLDGLVNLTSVGGDLKITENPSLTNLDGLANLTSVGGYLQIVKSPSLMDLDGLANLAIVKNYLAIDNNTALTNLDGLANLTIAGGLYIYSNTALTNLDGLAKLTVVDRLGIYNNDALTSIDGLANLASVRGDLFIRDNMTLTNLDGLAKLTSVAGYLYILRNTALSSCQGLAPVLAWPNGPPDDTVAGDIAIQDNGNGCDSLGEILASVSGPTTPSITSAVATSAGGISLDFSAAITTDTGFPITGYEAACKGAIKDLRETSAIAVLDNKPLTRTLTVSGYDPVSVMSVIEVDLDINHRRPEQLYVTLTTAQGTELVLWNRSGAGGEDIVGTFPTTLAPIDTFSSAAGQAMDGNWLLKVEDVEIGPLVREGVLNSWGLRISEGHTAASTIPPITLNGLTRGREYRCTVAAVTGLGRGPESAVYTFAASSVVISDLNAGTRFIERFYMNILGRPADEAGLGAWLDVINTQSASAVALGFLNSAEFKNKGLDDAAFVDILYRTLFDRAGDEGGTSYWLEQLSSGQLRDMVIWGFLRAGEFKTLSDSFGVTAVSSADESSYGVRAFTERFYTVVLGRQPDQTGFDSWVSALSAKTLSGGDIAKAFFLSPEYVGQNTTGSDFVETAYRAFFGRDADAAGKQGWLDVLSGGKSREYVLNGFIGSAEFAALASSYGINASPREAASASRQSAVGEVGLRSNDEASPIPVLPALGFFILAGLMGVLGIRRLVHR